MEFESIIGYKAIKLELSRIIDQLKHPDKYAELGVTEPHGLLLHGVPGVGKSTMAQSIIEASNRKAFVCRKDKSNGDFVNEIVRVFDEAAGAEPSVILLDDLDKFANEDERHCDAEEFVTVQSCIDKVKDKRVFVVATANNIRKLPGSLTRPGRFDHILELRSPEGQDAEDIVAFYLSKKSYVADMDVKRIARLLEGRSCAQLESVVNTWLRVVLEIVGDVEVGDEFVHCGYVFTALSKNLAISNNFLGCAKYMDEELLPYVANPETECTIGAVISTMIHLGCLQ